MSTGGPNLTVEAGLRVLAQLQAALGRRRLAEQVADALAVDFEHGDAHLVLHLGVLGLLLLDLLEQLLAAQWHDACEVSSARTDRQHSPLFLLKPTME